jgi:hypothetical protein
VRSVRGDNALVRLIRRKRPEKHSLAENECYDRTYHENLLGNVDLVPLGHQDPPVNAPPDADPRPRLTTRALKRQFEDRLVSRTRKRSGRNS